MVNDYKGVFGFPVTLHVTPSGGGSTEILGILTHGLPDRQINQEKIIPASGSVAGEEQVIIANEVSADIAVNVLFKKTSFLEVDAMKGLELAYVMVVATGGSDQMTYTGSGSLKSAKQDDVDPGKAMRASYTFTWNAGWTIA